MKRITIIGGGESGTLLSINLLKYRGSERLEINLVEKRNYMGRGVAYSADHDVHLLNVPAGKMGAFPDDVGHFHRWLTERQFDFSPSAFVPRTVFGHYLRDLLHRLHAACNTDYVAGSVRPGESIFHAGSQPILERRWSPNGSGSRRIHQ